MRTRKKIRMNSIFRKDTGTCVIIAVDHQARTVDRAMHHIGV